VEAWQSRRRTAALALVVGLAVVSTLAVSGTLDQMNVTLVALGFDPDRAQLIEALVAGGLTAAVVQLIGGIKALAVGFGFVVGVGLFGPTFVTETQNALRASGAEGSFDPGGWVITFAAFVTFAFLTAWASATVASTMRGAAEQALADVGRPTGGTGARTLRRPARMTALVVLSLVALVAAGNMFNFGANFYMTADGQAAPGLVPNGELALGPSAAPSPSGQTPSPSPSPGTPTPSPTPRATPTPQPTPPALAPAWQGPPPKGSGKVAILGLPAPWVNAGSAMEEVVVYTPPGYGASSATRYPTYYEAPFPFSAWNSAIHVVAALNALIDSGSIPPSIFVFINSTGGPFADPECANSASGSEQMDTFMGVTVPAYVDSHYRTIPSPQARVTFGMSEGGYCATILALHHPTTFGAAISLSGYFAAGASGSVARLPYGGNASVVAHDSPFQVAPTLPSTTRSGMYFVLVADEAQGFYGPQSVVFADTLARAGYPHSLIASSLPHGWTQVRYYLPRALELVAAWQHSVGVFR
jgi:hypothetical protein